MNTLPKSVDRNFLNPLFNGHTLVLMYESVVKLFFENQALQFFNQLGCLSVREQIRYLHYSLRTVEGKFY
jgi:hypothetical protein